MRIVFASLSTLVLAIAFTALARVVSHRVGLVAAPRRDRWHSKPTPLLGGLAIYIAFVAGFWFFGPRTTGAYAILAGGTLLVITGLVDDILHIKPYTKLVFQLIAASMPSGNASDRPGQFPCRRGFHGYVPRYESM